MRAIFHDIQCKSRSDKITIVPIGDSHLGCKNIDIRKLQGLIDWIATSKNIYWKGMGDYIDAINFSDKRFDPRTIDGVDDLCDTANIQVKRFIKMFKPIANKCIGLLGGNHEEKIRLKYHQDILGRMCEGLNVRNLTYSCLTRLFFKRGEHIETIVIYAYHGQGGGGTGVGKLNTILNKSKHFDADIYLMGHVHLKANLDGEKIGISASGTPRIIARKQLFATTGSFMYSLGDNYSPYSEVAGYDPIPTGFIKITVEPFRSTMIDGKEVVTPHLHMSV